jgi:hypothetical protein
MSTTKPDTIAVNPADSAAAAEIAIHFVSPSRSSSAPVFELITNASTVSMVLEMPTN